MTGSESRLILENVQLILCLEIRRIESMDAYLVDIIFKIDLQAFKVDDNAHINAFNKYGKLTQFREMVYTVRWIAKTVPVALNQLEDFKQSLSLTLKRVNIYFVCNHLSVIILFFVDIG